MAWSADGQKRLGHVDPPRGQPAVFQDSVNRTSGDSAYAPQSEVSRVCGFRGSEATYSLDA